MIDDAAIEQRYAAAKPMLDERGRPIKQGPTVLPAPPVLGSTYDAADGDVGRPCPLPPGAGRARFRVTRA